MIDIDDGCRNREDIPTVELNLEDPYSVGVRKLLKKLFDSVLVVKN